MILKRPLVISVLFFVTGIFLCIGECNPFFILFFPLAALIFVLFYKRDFLPLFLVFLLFFSFGIFRFYVYRESSEKVTARFDQSTVNTRAVILDFSSDGKASAEITLGKEKYKVYLSTENIIHMKPGDTYDITAVLSVPKEDKGSVFNFYSYLKGNGILFYARAKSLTPAEPDLSGFRGFVFSVRRYVYEVSEKHFSNHALSLFNSMVLGDKSLLSESLSAILKSAGLSHITVVSGMHLSIMVTALTFLITHLFGKRRIFFVLTAFAVIFITFFCGSGASVVRASIMCLVTLLARFLRREPDGLTSLFISVFLMAAYNPYIVLNAGFILSVLSVFGILLYSKKLTVFFMRIFPPLAANAAAVCISAQLTVTPALILLYQTVNPYALLANLLVFFMASFLVIFGMIFSAFSFLPVIATPLKYAISFLSDGLVAVCKFISFLPFSDIEAKGFSLSFMILWILFLFILFTGFKNKTHLRYTAVITAISLSICTVINLRHINDVHLRFLSYPEADSTLIFFPNGETALIDVFNPEDIILMCERYGKDGFTYAVATKRSFDDVLRLAGMCKIGTIIVPMDLKTESRLTRLERITREYSTDIVFADSREIVRFSRGIGFSYDSLGEEACNITALHLENKKFLTLQSVDAQLFSDFLKNGGTLFCDVLKLPNAFSVDFEKLEKVTTATIIADENEFFIKGK